MKRRVVLYRSSTIYDRHVCIDVEDNTDVIDFLEDEKNRKKFDYIVNRILMQNNIYYEDYEKIQNYADLSEMRIFPNGLNARIYCKELSTNNGHFYVVAARLLPKKKSRKINKEIHNFIKPIEGYKYDI